MAVWVHREAALRHVTPAALERLLIVEPVTVERCGYFAFEKARDEFARRVASGLAVTDYREEERETLTLLGVRLSSIYTITGTLIAHCP